MMSHRLFSVYFVLAEQHSETVTPCTWYGQNSHLLCLRSVRFPECTGSTWLRDADAPGGSNRCDTLSLYHWFNLEIKSHRSDLPLNIDHFLSLQPLVPLPTMTTSHFAQFSGFVPDTKARFDDEFDRLASSQDWAPGTQEYRRERTKAIGSELKYWYFSQEVADSDDSNDDSGDDAIGLHKSQDDDASEDSNVTPDSEGLQEKAPKVKRKQLSQAEQDLLGFHALCREVGIEPRETRVECELALKSIWVNIVDFIDAQRTHEQVKVWDDFEAFREYTLKKRIDLQQAKDDIYLRSLLQNLRTRRPLKRARGVDEVTHPVRAKRRRAIA